MVVNDNSPPGLLAELMADVYAVLDEHGTLEACLWAVGRRLSLDACSLIRIALEGRNQTVEAAVGYDEELRRRQRVLLGPEPIIKRLMARATPGSVWLDSDLRERVEFRETSYWRCWLVPQGFRGWGCVVVDRNALDATCLEFLGRSERLPFGSATLRLLKALAPHLRRVRQVKARTTFGATPEAAERAPQAIVLPGDLRRPTPFELQLRQRVMLTRAEARLASTLASGVSLKAAAERLHVSVNTARTHLAHIYDKTGVSRQAELLLVIMGGQAAPPSPDRAGARQRPGGLEDASSGPRADG